MRKFIFAVLALAACGDVKDNGHLADAPPGGDDAGIDAAPSPTVKATVLTLLGDGLPDPTAKVLFQGPDGAVIADVAPGDDGKAQADMPNGGTVSVIRVTTDTPAALNASIVMTTGVKPGDDLLFGLKAPPNITNQGGQATMTINFPAVTAAGSATFYTACQPGGVAGDPVKGVVTLTFRDSCHGAQFDLIGIATGGNLAAPQYVKVVNINYAANGTSTLANSFTPMGVFTATLNNMPDVISSMTFARSPILGDIVLAEQSAQTLDPPAGTVTATVPFLTATGTRSELVTTMRRGDSQSQQVFAAHTDALATTAALDLGSLKVPWITGLTATATGATWTTVEGGTPDGMLTQWTGRWTTAAGVASTIGIRVTQPAEASGMTLPRLPATYARLDPQAQTVTVTPSFLFVFFGDYDKIAGYDQLRQQPETLLTTSPAALGVFNGQAWQRRISSTSNLR